MLPRVSAHRTHLGLWHRTQKWNFLFRHWCDYEEKGDLSDCRKHRGHRRSPHYMEHTDPTDRVNITGNAFPAPAVRSAGPLQPYLLINPPPSLKKKERIICQTSLWRVKCCVWADQPCSWAAEGRAAWFNPSRGRLFVGKDRLISAGVPNLQRTKEAKEELETITLHFYTQCHLHVCASASFPGESLWGIPGSQKQEIVPVFCLICFFFFLLS